jgi:hypothetical protein
MPTASAVRIGCASNMERSTCQASSLSAFVVVSSRQLVAPGGGGAASIDANCAQRQQRGHSTNRCRRQTRQVRRSRFSCQFSRTSRALPIFGRRDSSDENGVGSGNPPYSISPYSPAGRRRTEFICNPDRASRGSTRFDVWCIDCHPRGAAGLYSGNTWPSLAMVVVPEKFFLISPSHSESGRSGGA